MARYVTHKNNLIAISGLSIFFFFGIWYTLSSKISDLLLLSEVKGKNSFLNYKMQACLLVEVIESTLVYLVERGFIIKVVQRLLGGGQKSSLGCNETIVNTSTVLTWILGYFWSLPGESVLISIGGMHVQFPPEL